MAKFDSKGIKLDSPFAPDDLFISRVRGREELSTLFAYEIEALSPQATLAASDALDQPAHIELTLEDGSIRYITGIITRFDYAGTRDGFALYRLVLRPSVWRFTLTHDCRIFQEMSALEIIKQVLGDGGYSDYQDKTTGSFETRTYCVQYNESDFDFVSRLMEQEGIYYYFDHTSSAASMVLIDDSASHSPCPGHTKVPWYPPDENVPGRGDHLDHWSDGATVLSDTCSLRDYDFEKPTADLTVRRVISDGSVKSRQEVYNYPGRYLETGRGDALARLRGEALRGRAVTAEASGPIRGLACGFRFTLEKCARTAANREHLVIAAALDISVSGYTSGTGATGLRCAVTTIPSDHQYRAPQTTPWPRMPGPQTAVVVGKKGEEIWTDKHGRIKVQFHWDREGKFDEKSSCWVRVAQRWTGTGWGMQYLPRIDQEVIVEFLDGDPDRPMVTGCVYNADNKVPYSLPSNQTQSGIKTRSTKKGGASNFNEIQFEDKKGNELFNVQAEKDMTILVKNDRTEEVQNDETITIKGNRTETVEKDETIEIKGKRTETVHKDEKLTLKAKRTTDITSDETLTIKGKRTTDVTGNDVFSTKGKATRDVTQAYELKALSIKAEANTTIEIKANASIELKVGGSSIKIDPSGVTIKGPMVTVDGSGMTTVKAGGILMLKGSLIQAS